MSPADGGTPRNAPCPCGSGRKFKHCCGAPGAQARTATTGRGSDAEGSYGALRELAGDALRRYHDDLFKDPRIKEWEDRITALLPVPAEDPSAEAYFVDLVIPLMRTAWVPEDMPLETAIEHTVASRWLVDEPAAPPDVRDMVDAARHAPLSIFQIGDVTPQTLRLDDLLTGETFTVERPTEPEGSELVTAPRTGTCTLAQVALLDGRGVVWSHDPRLLAEEYAGEITSWAEQLGDRDVSGDRRYRLIAETADVLALFGRLLVNAGAEMEESYPSLSDDTPVEWFEAEYRFAPEQRSAVLETLHHDPGYEEADRRGKASGDDDAWMREADLFDVLVIDGDPVADGSRMWGTIVVGPDRLVAQTLSDDDRRIVRIRIRDTLGELVEYVGSAIQEATLAEWRQAWAIAVSEERGEWDTALGFDEVPDVMEDPSSHIMAWVREALYQYRVDSYDEEEIIEAEEEYLHVVGEPPTDAQMDALMEHGFEPYLYFLHFPRDMPLERGMEHAIGARWMVDEVTAPQEMRDFVDAARHAPLSIFVIEAIDDIGATRLLDVLTDEPFDVELGPDDSHDIEGYLMLAQVAEHRGRTHLIGSDLRLLPPGALPLVRSFAEEMPGDARFTGPDRYRLLAYRYDVLALFGKLLERTGSQGPIGLANSDGEPLVWMETTMGFEPAMRSRITEALRAHEWFEADEDGGAGGSQMAPPGVEATKVEGTRFTWSGPSPSPMFGDSVIRGSVTVGPNRLMAQANSEERQAELLETLGQVAAGKLEHIETRREAIDSAKIQQAALEQAQRGDAGAVPWEDVELPPEAASALRGMFLAWADEEVPALGGKTPREAVKTARGRRAVKQLIEDWEARNERQPMPFADFDALRRELGLGEG